MTSKRLAPIRTRRGAAESSGLRGACDLGFRFEPLF